MSSKSNATHPPLPVPGAAAACFRAHRGELVNAVAQRMDHHPRIQALLGGNRLRLMDTTRRHHAAFMAEAMEGDDVALVERTLAWVYATYHNQGVSFDFFLSEWQTWQQVIAEILPAGEAGAIQPVYQWMVEHHDDLIDAARHYQARRVSVRPCWEEDYQYIVDQLIQGNTVGVIDRCHGLLLDGMSYESLLQNLFYPAMVDVGARWEAGQLSVTLEHQTTAMVYRVLAALYYDQPFPETDRGRGLVSPVSNEFHEMGSWMLAVSLELDGWDITLLTADTPPETLVATVLEERPRFVALSVTLVGNVAEARATVASLREALGADDTTPIVVGGQAFREAPQLAQSVNADLYLESAMAAVDWARGLGDPP
ncbi:MAG: cobalamin B12-binding domain-containing protein [Pseudomonadota bacterium]